MGSVVRLVNDQGAAVEGYEYDAYGAVRVFSISGATETLIGASAYGNPYLFTGRRMDGETGLLYLRHRYYHLSTGRFLTVDPLGGWEDAVNTGNPYAYVGNRPSGGTDPLGLLSSGSVADDLLEQILKSLTPPWLAKIIYKSPFCTPSDDFLREALENSPDVFGRLRIGDTDFYTIHYPPSPLDDIIYPDVVAIGVGIDGRPFPVGHLFSAMLGEYRNAQSELMMGMAMVPLGPVVDRLISGLLSGIGKLAGLAKRLAGCGSQACGGKGLTTPGKFFGDKSAKDASEALHKKFGPPSSSRPGAETFYNPKTGRSYNVHTDPAHGPPHVDIRTRGVISDRKVPLGGKGDQP